MHQGAAVQKHLEVQVVEQVKQEIQEVFPHLKATMEAVLMEAAEVLEQLAARFQETQQVPEAQVHHHLSQVLL